MASARVEGSDVVVRFGTVSGGNYYLLALRRLSDGKLLAAARAPGPTQTTCSFATTGANAPHTFGFLQADAGSGGTSTTGTLVVGLVGAAGLAWSPPVSVPLPINSTFENDLGWGIAFYDGSARLKSPIDGPAFTVIDQGTFPAYATAGWGKLVVSNPAVSGGADPVIRAGSRTDRRVPSSRKPIPTSRGSRCRTPHSPGWERTGRTAPTARTRRRNYIGRRRRRARTLSRRLEACRFPRRPGSTRWRSSATSRPRPPTTNRTRQVVFVVRLSDGKRWTIGLWLERTIARSWQFRRRSSWSERSMTRVIRSLDGRFNV